MKTHGKKKFFAKLKKSWHKLRFLDKTQLNYYLVTSFIGIFCLFTGTTYSLFTLTDSLSAATITIAKLSYNLTSSSSGYSSGTVTVAANSVVYIDLTLTSLNTQTTKYALNYSTSSSNVTVYYSQNLKNNMSGTISASGSITLRVVVENTGSSSATATLSVAGGYVQNSISTNITQGYYEQDITVRTILLDEDYDNATQSSSFPDSTSNYAYYTTVCSEDADPVWDYSTWSLTLNNLSAQISCDVYFKLLTDGIDIEITYILQDSDGKNGVRADSVPNDGTYTYSGYNCSTDATATWSDEDWKFTVSGLSARTLCVGYFNATS